MRLSFYRFPEGTPEMVLLAAGCDVILKDGRTVCTDKRCWVTNFIFSDGSRSPKCMGYTHSVCDRCGFSMGGEMCSLFKFSPATILAGLQLRRRVR